MNYEIMAALIPLTYASSRSVTVPRENGSAGITVAEGRRNPVAGLWGHILGEN